MALDASLRDTRIESGPVPAPALHALIDDVDLLRARHYDFLAALLGRAPTRDLFRAVAALQGDDSVLGRPTKALARAAAETSAEGVEHEYFDLFIGVGRGELLPYASYYLTGFLNDRPLVRVRGDLAALGIESEDGVTEPEDHVAILFDVMAGLAGGRFGAGRGDERAFFERHLKPWTDRFFADLETARSARFYRAVGSFGRAFVAVETEAFAMDG